MATIKSYTDLQQSKKLAEILPLESADGYWFKGFPAQPYMVYTKGTPNPGEHTPCWSLAALLGVLPRYIKIDGYTTFLDIYKTQSLGWVIEYSNNQEDFIEICFDNHNLIDACYEMILKLNELKML